MLILYSIQTFTIHLQKFVNTHSLVEPLLAFQLKSRAERTMLTEIICWSSQRVSPLASPLLSPCSPLHNVQQRKHSPSHTLTHTLTITHTY